MEQIKTIPYATAEREHANEDGIVILGAGGDLREWANGITGILFDEKLTPEREYEKNWEPAFAVNAQIGKKTITCLVMLFSENCPLDLSKMAIWRLKCGYDIMWWSDFRDNYGEKCL
jgi:hypothetical protein